MNLSWRALRTPIVLVVLIAILAWLAQWGWNNVLAPLPGQGNPECVPTRVQHLKTSQVSVNVYNGGSKRGLAKTVGNALETREFKVLKVSNTDEIVTDTVIVGATEDGPEVKLLAGFFPDASIRADNRSDGTVDLLVGSNYKTWNGKAPRTIEVRDEEACLPQATVEPSPTPGAPG